jgi:hypothetical protein
VQLLLLLLWMLLVALSRHGSHVDCILILIIDKEACSKLHNSVTMRK